MALDANGRVRDRSSRVPLADDLPQRTTRFKRGPQGVGGLLRDVASDLSYDSDAVGIDVTLGPALDEQRTRKGPLASCSSRRVDGGVRTRDPWLGNQAGDYDPRRRTATHSYGDTRVRPGSISRRRMAQGWRRNVRVMVWPFGSKISSVTPFT